MAAKSSSCAVLCRFQPSVMPRRFGIHEHGAIAVVPGEPQQAGLSGAIFFQSMAEGRRHRCRRARRWRRRYRRRRKARLQFRCDADARCPAPRRRLPGTRLTDRRDADDAGGGADHVDHVVGRGSPRRWRPSARRKRRQGWECRRAVRAFRPSRAERWPAIWSEVAYSPCSFSRTPASKRIDFDEKFLGRQAAELGVPHPFVAHRADAAFTLRGSVMPQSVAAAMSQCSKAVTNCARFSGLCRSQCSSFEKPHSEE